MKLLIKWAKKRKGSHLMLKVNFEKAYDLVSWKFLDYKMIRMRFNKKWKNWIRAGIFSSIFQCLLMEILVRSSKLKGA